MKVFVNGLTLSRILGTLLLPLLFHYCHPIITMVVIALLLLTDFFDGMLARKFKVQSIFGQLADQVADKVFGMVLLLIVASYYKVFYFVFGMEVSIALVNFVAALRGATTLSSFLGKFKTWITSVCILVGLFGYFQDSLNLKFLTTPLNTYIANEETILIVTISITIGVQITVLIDYIRHIFKELSIKKPKITYNFKDKDKLRKVLFDTTYYNRYKGEPLSKLLLDHGYKVINKD